MAMVTDRAYMLHAKDEFANIIKNAFPNTYNSCIFYYGDPEKPGHNLGLKITEKYVVCLFPYKKVFLVWDYEMHRKYAKYGAGQSAVNLNKSWEELLSRKNSPTFPYYKKMGTTANAPYEKVFVVHVNDWRWFFQSIDAYMSFNDYDILEDGRNVPADIAKQEDLSILDECIRKQYSSKKLQRKAEFREQVLGAYGYQCAICRCNIVEILQAAHRHGFEVAATDLNADKAENGICLCANHHLLYDHKLIDIDAQSGEVIVNNPIVQTMPSWNQFVDNGEKMIIPDFLE